MCAITAILGAVVYGSVSAHIVDTITPHYGYGQPHIL